MLIDFNEIADTSKIWIFQADRAFSDAEAKIISEFLAYQVDNWEAHQQSLLASYKIVENRFVILAADESQTMTSGCSLDAQYGWFKSIKAELNIDFFDRSLSFINTNDEIETIAINEIKSAILLNKITPNTMIYNNLVNTKSDFEKLWKIPANDSWLKRYFKTQLA